MNLLMLVAIAASVSEHPANTELLKSTECATTLIRTGELEEARKTLLSAVEIGRARGASDFRLGTALNNLGSVYHHLGDGKAAARYYREAVLMLKDSNRPDSGVWGPLINLGALRVGEGRLTEAETLYVQASEAISRALGSQAAESIVVLNGLADINIRRHRYTEAERYVIDSLERLEALGGSGQHRAMALFHLATIREHRGRLGDAEALLRRAIAAWEGSVGRSHPTYAAAITKLAILISVTKPVEAEALFRAALICRERQLGRDHAETGSIVAAYAGLLRKTGRKQEARLLQRRLEGRARSQEGNSYTVNISALERGERQ
jgi:tetratricopeptide (TPR) repeat protein